MSKISTIIILSLLLMSFSVPTQALFPGEHTIKFELITITAENKEWGMEEYHWKIGDTADPLEYKINNPRYGADLDEVAFFDVTLSEDVIYTIILVDKDFSLDWGSKNDDEVITLELVITKPELEMVTVNTEDISTGESSTFGTNDWLTITVISRNTGNAVYSGDIQFFVNSNYSFPEI
ncbi:MAG: hypothetical protein INQ03_08260 [Candidatus Heimdallarchaeota archaeon]|nr:hypothetical protein [Candidatus Heimdallarchaeota archaeon]